MAASAEKLPGDTGTRTFSTTFRGFDPAEVRAHLAQLHEEMQTLRDERDAARARMAGLPVLDEGTAAELLGEEAARLLTTAREGAAQIRGKAEENVARLLREAQDDAARTRADAEVEVARRLNEASEQAAAEIEDAKRRGREIVFEAQALRTKMLEDVARRRKAARSQLEALRAGREEMLAAFDRAQEAVTKVADDVRAAAPELLEPPDTTAEAGAVLADIEAGLPVAGSVPAPPEAERGGLSLVPPAPGGAEAGARGPNGSESAAHRAPHRIDVSSLLERPEPVGADPGRADDVAVEDAVDAPVHDGPADGPVVEESVDAPSKNAPATEEAVEDASGDEPATDEAVEDPVVEHAVPPAEADDDEASVGTEPEVNAASMPRADDIFARIRADRERAVTDARAVLDRPDAADSRERDDEPARPGVSAADAEFLRRRAAALQPLETTLARALKRALADEQNEALDRLRRATSAPAVAELVGSSTEQAARYAGAAEEALRAALVAGASSAGYDETAAGAELDATGVVTEVLGVMRAELVGPLRERVERAVHDAAGANDELGALLRAAYREWKVQRMDPVAGHLTLVAHGRGTLLGVPAGTPVRWLVDPSGPVCPDADDNALAGEVRCGDAFPTGHTHAPAHPGCRCALVRS